MSPCHQHNELVVAYAVQVPRRSNLLFLSSRCYSFKVFASHAYQAAYCGHFLGDQVGLSEQVILGVANYQAMLFGFILEMSHSLYVEKFAFSKGPILVAESPVSNSLEEPDFLELRLHS